MALAVAYQRFKTVPRQCGKIAKRRSRVHPVKLQTRGPLKSGERLDSFSTGEVSGPLVPIADNHCPELPEITRYVKRKSFNVRTLLRSASDSRFRPLYKLYKAVKKTLKRFEKWCARGDDFRTLLSELVSFVRQDEISAQENLRLGLISFIPATIIPATIRKTPN